MGIESTKFWKERKIPMRQLIVHGRVSWFGLAVLIVSLCCGATASAQGHDALGVAQKTATINCPGSLTGTCITLAIRQCPEAPDTTATVKIVYPPGGISASNGTVIFMTGEGGTTLYESGFTFGKNVIDDGHGNGVVPAGFTAVQFRFDNANAPSGWLTGPSNDGPRGLACRFATAAQWAYNNGSTRRTGSAFCATGNSAGSSAIAYALSQFGLNQNFDMVEITSGPPMGRVDLGCSGINGTKTQPPCNTPANLSYVVSQTETGLIDGAYGNNTNSCAVHDSHKAALWRHDSTYSENTDPNRTLSFPNTEVRAIYGGLDTSAAVTLGLDWIHVIKVWPSLSAAPTMCEPNDGHPIPNSLDGATQVASDLVAHCQLHH
jgi:hypothetical protein